MFGYKNLYAKNYILLQAIKLINESEDITLEIIKNISYFIDIYNIGGNYTFRLCNAGFDKPIFVCNPNKNITHQLISLMNVTLNYPGTLLNITLYTVDEYGDTHRKLSIDFI